MTWPLDLSFMHARPLVLRKHYGLRLILVGCGGTGSWLAPAVVRLARTLLELQRPVSVTFFDHDEVEAGNVLRQNFCDAEVGQNKAVTLARRYGTAWQIPVAAVPARFDPKLGPTTNYYETLTIVIGCVDNAAARKSIARYVHEAQYTTPPCVWWLDCGNAESTGQVLLGAAHRPVAIADAFVVETFCNNLPSPAVQHPELLVPRPEEFEDHNLSCEALALANTQSLMINQRVAAEAADFLVRMTLGSLTRFETRFDLTSGVARSKYITPENVAAVFGVPPDELFARRDSKQLASDALEDEEAIYEDALEEG